MLQWQEDTTHFCRAIDEIISAGVQDPSKPCVKNHHSLVLRAESASEKFMWLARLKNASDGGGTSGRAPLRAYTSDQLRADSVTSSVAPTPRSDGGRRGGVRNASFCFNSGSKCFSRKKTIVYAMSHLTAPPICCLHLDHLSLVV